MEFWTIRTRNSNPRTWLSATTAGPSKISPKKTKKTRKPPTPPTITSARLESMKRTKSTKTMTTFTLWMATRAQAAYHTTEGCTWHPTTTHSRVSKSLHFNSSINPNKFIAMTQSKAIVMTLRKETRTEVRSSSQIHPPIVHSMNKQEEWAGRTPQRAWRACRTIWTPGASGQP